MTRPNYISRLDDLAEKAMHGILISPSYDDYRCTHNHIAKVAYDIATKMMEVREFVINRYDELNADE